MAETLVFDLDDEYQRAIIRRAAASLYLEVVDGDGRTFTVRLKDADQAYCLGLEVAMLRVESQR